MPFKPKSRFEIVADDKTRKGVNSATSNMERLRKQITLTGTASVAAAGIAGLGAITAAGLRLGDQLAKTADKLGVSTEGLAGLRNAARLTGVETGKLDMGLQRMTRRVAEAAQGSGEAQNALRELGLDASRLRQLSPDEQFREIAEAMRGVSNQSDRVRLGFKLFDAEGVDLIRTLDLGAEGLDTAAREAEHFGTALSRVRAAEIEEAGDAMGRVRTAVEGLSTQLAASFAPAITGAANDFANWIGYITNTAIPAIRFLAENVGILELNVRALSLQELEVRAASLTDQIFELEREIANTTQGFGGLTADQLVGNLNAELEATKATLAEVQARIGQIGGGGPEQLSLINISSLPQRKDEEGPRRTLARLREVEAERKKLEEEREQREQETLIERARREEEQRQRELEAIRNFFKTREELELEAFARRDERILANTEAGAERDALLMENEKARAAFRVELEQRTQDEINRAVLAGTATREQFEKASLNTRAKAMFGFLSSITQGVTASSRTMFEINKAAAIGGALLDAKEAIVGAYKFGAKIGGPPLGAAMAGTAAAATATQVQAIRATSFGGGTTPSFAGSTPTFEGQPVAPVTPISPPESESSATIINEIHVHGDMHTDDGLERILRRLTDKGAVFIRGNSDQAREIIKAIPRSPTTGALRR